MGNDPPSRADVPQDYRSMGIYKKGGYGWSMWKLAMLGIERPRLNVVVEDVNHKFIRENVEAL